MNQITRWYLKNELQVVEEKLLRIRTLTSYKAELEWKTISSRFKKPYYEWAINKCKVELETLRAVQPALEDKRHELRGRLADEDE